MVAAAFLAGCTSQPSVETPTDIPVARDGDVWVVGIGYPTGEWFECFKDDSVAEAIMTTSLPSSAASATFTPEATEKDVRRVLDCLGRSLTGGTVSVTTRSG